MPVETAQVYWYGFNGDRKYAFLREDAASGFPWLTGRDLSALLAYRPEFAGSDHHTAPVFVTTPALERWPVAAAALLEELRARYGGPLALTRVKRGTFDCMPVSLASLATLERLEDALGAVLGGRLEPERLRSNLLLDTEGAPEEEWFGRTLRFASGARLAVHYPITRCHMVNLEPGTGSSEPRVLRAVAAASGGRAEAGVYAAVAAPGRVSLGDAVWLED